MNISKTTVRPILRDETQTVLEMVKDIFEDQVMSTMDDEGRIEFMRAVDIYLLSKPDNHFILVAENNEEISGMINIKDNYHISLFFVKQKYQKKGIGKKLLMEAIKECLKNEPDTKSIDVNSAVNSVDAYKNMGFIPTDDEKLINGIRFVPMEKELIHKYSYLDIDMNRVIETFESRGYEHLLKDVPNKTSVSDLEKQLKEYFLKYFDKDFIEERFELPWQFVQFLENFKGYFKNGDWGYAYGIDDILDITKNWYDCWDFDYEERLNNGEPGPDDTMWINFGNWSDKHEMVMTVDKKSPYFGKVVDTRGHPILHGDIYEDGLYSSFKMYSERHVEEYEE